MRSGLLLSSVLAIAGLWSLTAAPALGQVVRPVQQLEGVKVTEHLNTALPLNLNFRDDRGKPVRLSQIFDGQRPVVLSLNYASCPMLCGLQLNGMVDALARVPLEPGRDYQIVSVSIDPLETPVQARLAKQNYLRAFGRGNGDGWHFLTGREDEIRQLAEAVGFEYRYIPERREYAHAALFTIATPDGRLSRYLYGVRFDPQTVRLSLVEAAAGRIGTTLDQVLLFCFHYDALAGSYAPAAISLMKAGGAVTILGLLAFLIPWWFRRRPSPVATSLPPGSPPPTGPGLPKPAVA